MQGAYDIAYQLTFRCAIEYPTYFLNPRELECLFSNSSEAIFEIFSIVWFCFSFFPFLIAFEVLKDGMFISGMRYLSTLIICQGVVWKLKAIIDGHNHIRNRTFVPTFVRGRLIIPLSLPHLLHNLRIAPSLDIF